MDRDRQKSEWEKKQLLVEEQRTREEQNMRRQQEDMQLRMSRQEEELRRRQQENTLFMQVRIDIFGFKNLNLTSFPFQAQQLNSLLDQQEHGGSQSSGGRKFNEQSDNRRTYDMMNQNSGNQVSRKFFILF